MKINFPMEYYGSYSQYLKMLKKDSTPKEYGQMLQRKRKCKKAKR